MSQKPYLKNKKQKPREPSKLSMRIDQNLAAPRFKRNW